LKNWSEDTHIDNSITVKSSVERAYRHHESLTSPLAPTFWQTITSNLGMSSDGDMPQTLGQTYYEKLVEEYTRRKVTYETDVLHAFRGIEQVLSKRIPGSFNFGLPDILLDEALLWQPVLDSKPDVRSRPFPSFSWASWNGPVQYKHQSGIRSVICWLDQNPDGTLCFSDNRWVKKGGHPGWGSDAAELRYVSEATVNQYNEQLAKEPERFPHRSIATPAKGDEPNYLAFYTKINHFRLELQRSQGGHVHPEWCICKVLHGDKELEGTGGRDTFELEEQATIAVPMSWLKEHGDQPYKFILIALECRSFAQEAHIMLVEQMSGHYRRVALTKVDWMQWEATKPEIRLVNLL
jgi:hypothetical protein